MATLISAPWIIPVNANDDESNPTICQDHALVMDDDGTIIALLPLEAAMKQHPNAFRQHLSEHILMPGLINAHTHAAMSLFRGMADDLPLMDWLNNHIWPAEGQWVNPEFVRAGTQLAIAEMFSSGTTCMADMYFFPDTVAKVATEHHMRTVLSCPVMDFPTAWAQNPKEYLSKADEVFQAFQGESLISVGIGPHAPYTVSDEPLQQCVTFSDEHNNAHIQIHLHETEQEVTDAVAKDGHRPIERLANLGFLNDRLTAVHMTALNDADITSIAKHKVSTVHCPESNLKLASGFSPVDALHNKGVNVALGTDGAASNNDLDMFGEMRTAAILAKAVSQDASAVPAYRALRMATINGAKALGLDDRIGSLEPGKTADMIAININSPHTTPLYSPISQLVYCAGREQVTHAWVGGKPVLQDRRLLTLDSTEILSEAKAWAAKIAKK